eukprot:90553_1
MNRPLNTYRRDQMEQIVVVHQIVHLYVYYTKTANGLVDSESYRINPQIAIAHSKLRIRSVIIAALKRLLFCDVHQDVATNTTDAVMGIAKRLPLIEQAEHMKVSG